MTKRQFLQHGKQLATKLVANKRFIAGVACVITAVLSYVAFANYTEQYEVGVTLNIFTQDVGTQNTSGFHLTAPWSLITVIDTRPQRVCITSASRAFNCKLVQFDQTQYKEFVATEGFRYYWLANRFSFNLGYNEEYRGMRDVLRGYGFSAKKYSFLKVLEDY